MEVKGKEEKMPMETFIRWACLVDAIDVISDKCDSLGMGPDDDSWIKPNAIEKFINDRYLPMKYRLVSELQ